MLLEQLNPLPAHQFPDGGWHSLESPSFSPKSFLKARRPERFSDSVIREVDELDRSLLEFHIDSLTSRGQETDFERFARRLCERGDMPQPLAPNGSHGRRATAR